MLITLIKKTLWHHITRDISFKGILLSLLLLSFGFLHYTIAYREKAHYKIELSNEKRELFSADTSVIYEDYSAIDIFFNNIRVGLLISVAGFVSGGILTVLVLYWNGFLLADIFFSALSVIPTHAMFYCLKHAPLEIFAFTLFSIIGFRGFYFYKKILRKEDNVNAMVPKPIEFLVPTFLLLIASFIEVL